MTVFVGSDMSSIYCIKVDAVRLAKMSRLSKPGPSHHIDGHNVDNWNPRWESTFLPCLPTGNSERLSRQECAKMSEDMYVYRPSPGLPPRSRRRVWGSDADE